MEHADVERLRERHPAWRLLRAGNAPLVLTFLGRFFVEDNNGATSGPDLTAALDDDLYALNAGDPDKPRYPKSWRLIISTTGRMPTPAGCAASTRSGRTRCTMTPPRLSRRPMPG